MHMQYTRSILSLNSPVEKVRTEHLANPYDIQRCRIQCPQTFLKKNICKSPKAEFRLGTYIFKTKTKENNKAIIVILDLKEDTKQTSFL